MTILGQKELDSAEYTRNIIPKQQEEVGCLL